MSHRSCTRCGAGNVDRDGYCWSCERHTAGPVAWRVPEAQVQQQPDVAVAKPRGGTTRTESHGILAALTTLVVIVVLGIVGVAAVELFRIANAAAQNVALGGTQLAAGSAERCLVGQWKLSSAQYGFDFRGSTRRMTAAGGTMLLNADGAGSTDYSGYSGSAVADGVTVAQTRSGSRTFTYQIDNGRMGTRDQSISVTTVTTVPGSGQVTETQTTPVTGQVDFSCGGNTLVLQAGADRWTYTRME